MAAVGDSVVWGQALPRDQKFVFLTERRLRDAGIDITLSDQDFLAHSGAVIVRCGSGTVTNCQPGPAGEHNREIADCCPTIPQQIRSLGRPDEIDVLVFDGGANDSNWGFFQVSDRKFEKWFSDLPELIEGQTRTLLQSVTEETPQALAFFTGYYPGLSPESRIPFTAELVKFGALFLLGHLSHTGPVSIVVMGAVIAEEQKDLKRQALAFHLQMLHDIQRTLHDVCRGNPTSRFVFIHPGFTYRNSAHADDPFVTGMQRDPNPDIRAQRVDDYNEFEQDQSVDEREVVRRSHWAHPNERGAERYADGLTEKVQDQLAFSLRDHLDGILPDDETPRSVRTIERRFRFFVEGSLRRLANLKFVNSVTLDFHFPRITAVTDMDSAVRELGVDLGWKVDTPAGPVLVSRDAHVVDNGGLAPFAVADFYGQHPMREVKRVRIRWPKRTNVRSFSGSLVISINGIPFPRLNIASRHFEETDDAMVWSRELAALL